MGKADVTKIYMEHIAWKRRKLVTKHDFNIT